MDWECCWTQAEIGPEACPNIGEGEEELYTSLPRRVVEKCLDCPQFKSDLSRVREGNPSLADILAIVAAEVQGQKAQLQSTAGFLTSKTREIRFLHELNVVLQTSMDLDEVLSVALTAITAGKGFGMNRAYLLMTDKERKCLSGYLGIGPRNYEEAWHIWEDVSHHNFSLKEMARHFRRTKLSSEKVKFQDILEKLTVPLGEQQHIFNVALRERKPILISDAFHNPRVGEELARVLGVDSFLVMPLISRNRRIGVIVADNCITHRTITPQDIQSLETFAFPVAFALERASLYEKLQEQIGKLTEANAKLKEQQELIVKMEKMALMGRITSSIAHSIRNPVMIIGGFARSLLKSLVPADPKREYVESIAQEAKQLEEVLNEVLNYSDSLYPAVDRWGLNQLVRSVCDELAPQLEKRQVASHLELADDLPPVFIDYKKIAYCLRTVISNSVENVPGVRVIRVRTWQDGEAAYIEVADDGTPISPATREALTTPFATTQELGVGPALALCATILEKYGNRFTIETPAESGTTYTIRLQLHKEEP